MKYHEKELFGPLIHFTMTVALKISHMERTNVKKVILLLFFVMITLTVFIFTNFKQFL